MDIAKIVEEVSSWFPGKKPRERYASLQAFTDYVCKGCGRVHTHHNSSTPKFCPQCIKEMIKYLENLED